MTDGEKQQLARQFLSVLGRPDEGVLNRVAAADMIWSFPGASPISGEARGIAGIMERARTIAAHHVHVETLSAVYGHSGVAMILHNTGLRDGHVLDEQVAAVFSFRGDKIERLDTFLSDVPMMESFFAHSQ
jgi:ketosteroid isomerase-like protein